MDKMRKEQLPGTDLGIIRADVLPEQEFYLLWEQSSSRTAVMAQQKNFESVERYNFEVVWEVSEVV